jgi:hypothetical protein
VNTLFTRSGSHVLASPRTWGKLWRRRDHEAVQGLALEDERDAEPRLLEPVPLEGVVEHRPVAGAQPVVGVVHLPERVGQVLVGVSACGVEDTRLQGPSAGNLVDLLLDRQPPQQVGHALLDREPGVL